ncbi:MAG: Gfo/Idh/MocA family oxidoreductase [Vicinamibacteria bacterium]
MKPVRVAILGAGKMAREHARAFASLPEVEVCGIASRTRGTAETMAAELGVPVVADTVQELYERTRADLLVVTVIETALVGVTLEAMECPWTLLLEKPPGLTPEDTRQLLSVAKTQARRVFVGLNRQFLGSTQEALRLLRTETGVRFVKVQDQQSLEQAHSIGHSPAVVDGWMYANSIHLVDYFRIFARGAATEVRHVVRWNPREGVGLVLAHLAFESGDTGVYEAFWRSPGPWAATIQVPGRRMELRPLEELRWQATGEPLQTVLRPSRDVDFKPGFVLQAENAVAACRGLRSDCPTLEDSLRTMSLLERIYYPKA